MIGPWNGSQNVSRVKFSLQTRDLECFANRKSIPWKLLTILCPDLIATILQRCLLSLCALLFQQSHLFPICGVDVQRFQERFTRFAKFQGIVSVNNLRLPIRLQELLPVPLGFLRSFCFARIRLDPLGGQTLHHDCISMIVSRFAVVAEDLVICCYQVTKFFSTKHGSANASSARSSCNFGPLADLAISVFREVSLNTVYPNPHFS